MVCWFLKECIKIHRNKLKIYRDLASEVSQHGIPETQCEPGRRGPIPYVPTQPLSCPKLYSPIFPEVYLDGAIYMYNSKRRDTFTFSLTGRPTNTNYNIQENVDGLVVTASRTFTGLIWRDSASDRQSKPTDSACWPLSSIPTITICITHYLRPRHTSRPDGPRRD